MFLMPGSRARPKLNRGWTLLNTLTAVNSASLTDTTSLTKTALYSTFVLVFQNIVAATNATGLQLQVHSAGAFQAASYICRASQLGTAYTPGTSTTLILLSAAADLTNTAPGFSGTVFVSNPSQTTAPKIWTGHASYFESGATLIANIVIGGFWNANGAIDGFQVTVSTGNITSGVVRVYGLP
jgi:hypothetical protein